MSRGSALSGIFGLFTAVSASKISLPAPGDETRKPHLFVEITDLGQQLSQDVFDKFGNQMPRAADARSSACLVSAKRRAVSALLPVVTPTSHRGVQCRRSVKRRKSMAEPVHRSFEVFPTQERQLKVHSNGRYQFGQRIEAPRCHADGSNPTRGLGAIRRDRHGVA
jgi:hypothetical protein